MSRLFTSGGQNMGASASASVLPMNIQDWFPLGLTSLIALLSKGFSRVFSQCHSWKASILQHSAFFMVELLHPSMTTGKKHSFEKQLYWSIIYMLQHLSSSGYRTWWSAVTFHRVARPSLQSKSGTFSLPLKGILCYFSVPVYSYSHP